VARPLTGALIPFVNDGTTESILSHPDKGDNLFPEELRQHVIKLEITCLHRCQVGNIMI
jgi:hypothetical protein